MPRGIFESRVVFFNDFDLKNVFLTHFSFSSLFAAKKYFRCILGARVYVEATKHGIERTKVTPLCNKNRSRGIFSWYFDELYSSIYHEIPPWDVGF